MDSAINIHLAVMKLQDSLRVAENARAASAAPRPERGRRLARLATVWQGNRGRAAATAASRGPRTAVGS